MSRSNINCAVWFVFCITFALLLKAAFGLWVGVAFYALFFPLGLYRIGCYSVQSSENGADA